MKPIANDNQNRVWDWMNAIPAQAECLSKTPTIPDLSVRILRARLMLEEVMETIQKGLGLDIWLNTAHRFEGNGPKGILIEFDEIKFEKSDDNKPDLIEIADGLADQEVVNHGTANACGIDHQKIFDIVMDNNDAKLERGTIDKFGKLVKPPDHVGPGKEIEKELEAQRSGELLPLPRRTTD